MALGIISGTGLYELPVLSDCKPVDQDTPYGKACLFFRKLGETEVFLLPRHGKEHSLPPHLINYRANIWALAARGVTEILSFCCVGSLIDDYPPGSLVCCEDFIDMTSGRQASFTTGGQVEHTDFTEPYCRSFTQEVRAAAKSINLALNDGGIYICTQGPRLETPAEIRAFRKWGANLVGMTAVPEVILAREAGLCYSAVAIVSNYASGMTHQVNVAQMYEQMHRSAADIERLIRALAEKHHQCHRSCTCAQSRVRACVFDVCQSEILDKKKMTGYNE